MCPHVFTHLQHISTDCRNVVAQRNQGVEQLAYCSALEEVRIRIYVCTCVYACDGMQPFTYLPYHSSAVGAHTLQSVFGVLPMHSGA